MTVVVNLWLFHAIHLSTPIYLLARIAHYAHRFINQMWNKSYGNFCAQIYTTLWQNLGQHECLSWIHSPLQDRKRFLWWYAHDIKDCNQFALNNSVYRCQQNIICQNKIAAKLTTTKWETPIICYITHRVTVNLAANTQCKGQEGGSIQFQRSF